MHFCRNILLLVALAAGTGLTAQQSTNRTVNARADLARKEITIGDQLYLNVNISAPPGTKVYAIATAAIDELPAAEVISDEGLRTLAEAPELLLEQRFLITSFDTGYVAIPPIAIYFEDAAGLADTAYTNDLLLTVNGAVVSAEDDILPIKPIIEEGRNWTDYWWLYLIVALAVAGFALRKYSRRYLSAPVPTESGPLPPAHVRALAELDRLEEQALWQKGETDAYYVELTRILRTYLEQRFDLRAMEMTSTQLIRALQNRRDMTGAQRGELAELLRLSDLVKFARAAPAEELHPRGMERVREFVIETAPAAELSIVKAE